MNSKERELFTRIASAPQGFSMVKPDGKALAALIAEGLVETNPDTATHSNGQVPARLTPKGHQTNAANPGGEQPQGTAPMNTTTATPGAAAPSPFAIDGFAAPAKTARAGIRAKNTFGGLFDQAPTGGTFFVPAAAGVKHPTRAVKLAALRYAREGVKRFSVYIVESGKTYGSFVAPSDGAVVVRVADATGPAEVKKRAKKAAVAA